MGDDGILYGLPGPLMAELSGRDLGMRGDDSVGEEGEGSDPSSPDGALDIVCSLCSLFSLLSDNDEKVAANRNRRRIWRFCNSIMITTTLIFLFLIVKFPYTQAGSHFSGTFCPGTQTHTRNNTNNGLATQAPLFLLVVIFLGPTSSVHFTIHVILTWHILEADVAIQQAHAGAEAAD